MKQTEIEVEVLGMKFKVPKYQDCNKCGSELSVKWSGVCHDQPCIKCKNSEEYEYEQLHRKTLKDNSIDEAMKTQRVASVWQVGDRLLYGNHKGDLIKDEKFRPIKSGKKDW